MIKRKRIFAGMLLIALFIQSTICIAATKSTNISVTSSGASIQNLNGSYSQLSAVVNKSTLHARVTNTTNTSRYVTVTVARYYDGKPDRTKKNSNGVVPGNGEKRQKVLAKVLVVMEDINIILLVLNIIVYHQIQELQMVLQL
ncbi:MAG: hypothetical protein PUA71_06705 [Eubacteriales bacterium]|nr:hypothetical protein [Eubacteriales bacterium]